MTSAPPISAAAAPTLASVLSGRRNAYGFIRFVLASLVIVDHAYPLGGFGADPFWVYTLGQQSLGGIAVSGFFVVSGFLIARSAMSVDFLGFLWRRVLRIFPAFWLVLLVSALIVGPWMYAVQHGSLSGYFTRGVGGPIRYFLLNAGLEIKQPGILDVFVGTPYGLEAKNSVFNGSLWTLIYEWQCYLILGLLGVFGVLRWARALVPVAAIALIVMGSVHEVIPEIIGGAAPWLADIQFVRLTGVFLLGSAAALYPERVPLNGRLALGAAILATWTMFVVGGFHLIGVIGYAYVLLWFAYRAPSWFFTVGSKNDYSYGVYVYGFLVQMVLAQFGVHRWGIAAYILIAWVATVACAMVSWHVVEKPALSLKSWGPGDGWPWLRRLVQRRA